ncbi:MAG: hypothetical protein U5R06_05640 [candidate division KSB1 bacterium]|nr:hypothetical protein [candidate division KSB1 bacterium]
MQKYLNQEIVKLFVCQKDYRLDVDSVKINKINNLLVLIPENDPWLNFIDGVNKAEEFPKIDDHELNLKKIEIQSA